MYKEIFSAPYSLPPHFLSVVPNHYTVLVGGPPKLGEIYEFQCGNKLTPLRPGLRPSNLTNVHPLPNPSVPSQSSKAAVESEKETSARTHNCVGG